MMKTYSPVSCSKDKKSETRRAHSASHGSHARPIKNKITAEEAVLIFQERKNRKNRDQSALTLSLQYGLTSKAISDIWNLRTWRKATRPYWCASDVEMALCDECLRKNHGNFYQQCAACIARPLKKKRTNSTLNREHQDMESTRYGLVRFLIEFFE